MIGRISPVRSTLSSPAQIGRLESSRLFPHPLSPFYTALLSSLEGSRRVMEGSGEDQEKGASAYKRRGAGALRGLYWGKLCPSLICSKAWPRGGGYGGAALRVWRSCCSWRWSLEMGKGVDLSKKKAKRERERAIQIQASEDSRRSQTQHDIWRQQQQSVEDNLNLEEILGLGDVDHEHPPLDHPPRPDEAAQPLDQPAPPVPAPPPPPPGPEAALPLGRPGDPIPPLPPPGPEEAALLPLGHPGGPAPELPAPPGGDGPAERPAPPDPEEGHGAAPPDPEEGHGAAPHAGQAHRVD